MKTVHRFYSESAGDFNRLCRLITSLTRPASPWCLGRVVDWKHGLYANKRAYASFCEENAHLWFDAFGDLAGAAISESGDAGFAILTLPGYRFLYEEILLWALENWRSRGPALSTEITEYQDVEARLLERYGFANKATFYTRRWDLTGELVPRPPLEPGFTIVDMQAHPDYRAQRILRADAFEDKPDLTEEELASQLKFYNYGLRGPIYHPQTDLCVMAPDGRFVAACEALIDARNLSADIERVCTHSQFRRRGFARAVIIECLYRLQEIGLHSAYITGYSLEAMSLYGSIGAKDEFKCYVFEEHPGSR